MGVRVLHDLLDDGAAGANDGANGGVRHADLAHFAAAAAVRHHGVGTSRHTITTPVHRRVAHVLTRMLLLEDFFV